MNTDNKHKVLILGGGFGGIKTALELCGEEEFDVTLISDHDDFRYYPSLYRAATGSRLAAASIPIADIFSGKDLNFIKDSVETIDKTKKSVKTVSGKDFTYDTLVLSLGVVTNFFGIKGLSEYAYGIKTLDEAKRLRDHIHKQLVDDKKPDLNYVVIGGGPTGVELAGALPAYIRRIMKDHNLPGKAIHVDLVEAAPHLVQRMPRSYSRAVEKHLRKLGIKLYLGHTVEAETADTLSVSGHSIKSHTVVWTAGVTNHPFLKENGFELSEHGKAKVNEYLQAEGDIYVIGDNADTPYSGMAQTALYDAVFLAGNLKRAASGRQMRAYVPKKPVYVIPAGPNWAAVLWGRFSFYGRVGWLLRSAADFAGYHDYEPWWKASKLWIAESEIENDCPTCASK